MHKIERRAFLADSAKLSLASLIGISLLESCNTQKKLHKMIIPADAAYKMDVIRGQVGYFSERGGTIGWLATKEAVVIVDTQFEEQATHLKDQLMQMGVSKIDMLVNTHHHGDHTAGNGVFRPLATKIIAHQNSRDNQLANAQKNNQESTVVLPDNTINNSYIETIGNQKVSLHYFGPAHTNGDIIVHFENANVAHIGDLCFNRRFPYIDKGAGASISNWIEVLDQIDNHLDKDSKLIWGHADNGFDIKGSKDDIKPFKNYLERLLEFGQKCIKEGKTAEEVIATTTTIPGAPEWTGKGIERSINAVYEELK